MTFNYAHANFLKRYEKSLIEKAIDERAKAFSPISGSQVGAAVLVYDGKIFGGSNVEFARSQNIHAEWIAASDALKYTTAKLNLSARNLKVKMRKGLEEIVAIAIVNEAGIPSCGSCRQMLYEINLNMRVLGVLPNGEFKVRATLRQLYPNAYQSNDGLKI